MQPLTILLAEPNAQDAAFAKKTFAAEAKVRLLLTVNDRAGAVTKAAELRPDVVLLDIAVTSGDPGGAVREIIARAPTCTVVLSGPAATPPDVVLSALVAGASGYQIKPCAPEDLIRSLLAAHAHARQLLQLRRGDTAPSGEAARGAVIAVYSPKGGVGCTTIATNLAVALGQRTRASSIALVDLDLQFGDIGIALDLKASNTILDLLSFNGAADGAIVRDVFVTHQSGIRVLVAPESLAVVESIDPTKVVRALDGLRSHFSYIVCDLWSSLEDLTMAVLGTADRVILVTTPELPSIRNVRRVLRATDSIQLDARSLVVVNRSPAKAGLEPRDIERALGRGLTSTIPSDGVGVTEAINRGSALVDSRAHPRIGQSFRQLADLLVGELGLRDVPEQGAPGRDERSVAGQSRVVPSIGELRARP
jgi:pilus assembly protein CpaE